MYDKENFDDFDDNLDEDFDIIEDDDDILSSVDEPQSKDMSFDYADSQSQNIGNSQQQAYSQTNARDFVDPMQDAVHKTKPKSSVPFLLLVLCIMLVVMGVTKNKDRLGNITAMFSNTKVAETLEDVKVSKEGDDFFANAMSKNEQKGQQNQLVDVPVNAESTAVKMEIPVTLKTQSNGKTNIPVRISGRSEPFAPVGHFVNQTLDSIYSDSDAILPPVAPVLEPEVVNEIVSLSKITVNGILYDKNRPSAIIKSNNVDYLVHKGDMLAEFKIVDIKKDEVAIKYGDNIQYAVIGQEVTAPEGIKKNEVVQITQMERNFGGAYSKSHKGVILINNEIR